MVVNKRKEDMINIIHIKFFILLTTTTHTLLITYKEQYYYHSKPHGNIEHHNSNKLFTLYENRFLNLIKLKNHAIYISSAGGRTR